MHETAESSNTSIMAHVIRWCKAVLLLAALYGIINGMGKIALTQSLCQITSDKVSAPVRIAVIADLHNTPYGENQTRLMAHVRAARPDFVAIAGDAFHDKRNEPHTIQALTTLAAEYPCYYVTGNHERNSGEADAMKAIAHACGVTVLDGASECMHINGQTVQLCGLNDYATKELDKMQTELIRVSAGLNEDILSVLLVHRPERFSDYLPCGFDLIVAGHAHGGQWRLPGARSGLFAPGQGWFPQYAGGQYDFGGQTMCVSRGLSNKPIWLARFGNPPEIMLVTVNPA